MKPAIEFLKEQVGNLVGQVAVLQEQNGAIAELCEHAHELLNSCLGKLPAEDTARLKSDPAFKEWFSRKYPESSNGPE